MICTCRNTTFVHQTVHWDLRTAANKPNQVQLNYTDCDPLKCYKGIALSKRDGTCAETRFGLSAKRTSPFKSVGVSAQLTTGSRGVRISRQRLYRPCSDVQCKAAGYPLHSHLSPSLPLPCVTMCHQVPNTLYTRLFCHNACIQYVCCSAWVRSIEAHCL